jgi:hypothetical protein
MIFGWLRKKLESPKKPDTYKAGEWTADRMTAHLDAIMKGCAQIHENYLGVLRGNFEEALTRQDAPPLKVARFDCGVFVENIDDELKPKLKADVTTAMREWFALFDAGANVQDAAQQAIQQQIDERVSRFTSDLLIAGLTRG